jgi:xanthine dehydrogenase accessory factor
MSWASDALEFLATGPAALVTIAQVSGSAPREAGTKMIVTPTQLSGTVGGGNLEHLLTEQARRLLGQSDVDVLQQDYPLGPLLAQCCGGRVRILIERLDASSEGWLTACDAAERSGRRYVLEGVIHDGRIARTIHENAPFTEPGVDLFAGAEYADPKRPWGRIVERIVPVTDSLIVFGAGHVGRAIASIAAALPFRLSWYDNRAEAAEPAGDVAPIIRRDLVAAVREAAPRSFFLVLTHSHDLDYDLVRAILTRGDARYCGLIGSATKRARFASRLQKDGLDPAAMTCPIGAGPIRSKHPTAIAVAACHELLVLQETPVTAVLDTVR